jgi:hypothetical protein
MNKQALIAVAIVLALVGFKFATEYNLLKASVAEARQEAISVARECKEAVAESRRLIADLRSRILRQEQDSKVALEQMSLKASMLQQQLQSIFEADLKSKSNQDAINQDQETSNQIRDSPEPEVDVKPVLSKITMHSNIRCRPCTEWKSTELSKWQASGWQVEVIEETTTNKTWPWFEVCEGNRCYEVIGPLTATTLARAKSIKSWVGPVVQLVQLGGFGALVWFFVWFRMPQMERNALDERKEWLAYLHERDGKHEQLMERTIKCIEEANANARHR